MSERLRLLLERAGAGYRLRDAASGEVVRWEDPRVVVVPVAGVSFRIESLADPSFEPGRPLALVPEPENEHDPNAVGVWNEERTLQLGYVLQRASAYFGVFGVAQKLTEALRLHRIPLTYNIGQSFVLARRTG